jgi:hypothetical protein
MRSAFIWWCKRMYRAFKHEFKTDWQFRLSVIVLPIAITAIALFANNSALFQRFFNL